MKNEWFAIDVRTQGVWVELVGAVLAESGCSGTVVDEQDLDTFVVPDEGLEDGSFYTLKAYFPDTYIPEAMVSQIKNSLASIPALQNQPIAVQLGLPVRMEDWAENWKQNFSTLKIGSRLIIRPSWEPEQDTGEAAVVEIDPGMAFGTGTHGTTRLCLEVIESLLNAERAPVNMLDVGTGSGILALGAAALGCRDVLANDIDPSVCDVARENVRNNGFDNVISVTDQSLERLAGQFELVVANILAEENVRLRQHLYDRMASGGFLVLSGILKEKETYVLDSFKSLNLQLDEIRYADEWVCIIYHRPE